ncbi:hypothetical protein VTO73DRAFT_4019 [Trametes versicolor]
MSASRVWLITGSSSGFGRETVIQALEAGDKVVATLRKPAVLDDLAQKYPADRLRVSLVEPGSFKTSAFNDTNMIMVPQHPAYANPALPVHQFRGAFLKGAGQTVDTATELPLADAARAVGKIIEFAKLPDPPRHFPLGKDAIAMTRGTMRALAEQIDQYESWSGGLDK